MRLWFHCRDDEFNSPTRPKCREYHHVFATIVIYILHSQPRSNKALCIPDP